MSRLLTKRLHCVIIRVSFNTVEKLMPNHVKNVITIVDTGGVPLETIRAAFVNDEGRVDFNVIMPEPECLSGFEPHSGIVSVADAKTDAPLNSNPMIASLEMQNRATALNEYEGMSDEDKESVARAIENIKECGYAYWYDWRTSAENWGTKWNAYGQPDEGYPEDATEYTFETAWSHPFKLMRILSERLPEVTFNIKYADEDLGSNCGVYIAKNGEALSADIAPAWSEMADTEKAHYTKMAFELNYPGEDPRTYGYGEDWLYDEELAEKYYR